jgi:ferredoxin
MPEHVDHKLSQFHVRIDRERCIGSGNCVKVAPEVFELDDGAIVRFRADARDIEPPRLIEACDVCPVDALIVHDQAGKQIVP